MKKGWEWCVCTVIWKKKQLSRHPLDAEIITGKERRKVV